MTWPTILLLVAGVVFILGIFSKISTLQRRSKEIEKTLDYSKMEEWEDEDDR